MSTKTSFLLLNPDSIRTLTNLTSDITENSELRVKCDDMVREGNWEGYVKEMMAVSERVMQHTASGSKAFFAILTHLVLSNFPTNSLTQIQFIHQIISTCLSSTTSIAASLRLDILINLMNMIDMKEASKLHAEIFVKIVRFALETEQHKRIVLSSHDLIKILEEYENNLSHEEKVEILLLYATLYERLHRRSDAHHIYQEYLTYSQDQVSQENLGRVVANVVKTSNFREIAALAQYKAIASSGKIAQLLKSVLARDVQQYLEFYNQNQAFVDSISTLNHNDILQTVRTLALTEYFAQSNKTTFSYDELRPVLKLEGDVSPKDVERWIIKGMSAKLYRARLNPRNNDVTVSTMSRTAFDANALSRLQNQLERVDESIAQVTQRAASQPDLAREFKSRVAPAHKNH